MEKQILYEGKVVKGVKRYSGAFNVKYNEQDTYIVFFEDGSQTSVSESVAATLFVELQKQKELNKMKINVLGTEYDVELLEEKDECMEQMNAVGHTDKTTKQIKVFKYKCEEAIYNQNPIVETNITMRHELLHAFLFECGIEREMQFHNEECVDFFAIQFPKLVKMFEEANCKE